ncbi:aldehyde dehydrogenase [Rhodococcus sp. T7]|uniref:aldehyde dehydrogenase n=1 Tax=Rhodococcus sp. T7 TaxID=627444 RepID=UPI00135AE26E|nr:aldehyde dehydrogenase [Rhodococcus sp. T7]KAF0960880.1 NAD/NADP-dependent betaine aldehyde dehydrogenase [Rhodococcus sp. T7]
MTSITQNEVQADRCGNPPSSMFIGGTWTAAAGGETMESIDPSNGLAWTRVPAADGTDVDRAVASATEAMAGEWGATPGPRRAHLLNRLADLVDRDADRLAAIETRDNGKLIRETRPVMGQVSAWLRYYAGAADKLAGQTLPTGDPNYLVYTTREPVGVVAAIVPFNSPVMITTMKVAPALAAGCAVVVKTADQTPTSTLLLAELVEEAGFPPGAFNVLTGPGATVGDALARHPGVAKVSFTGSTAVGTHVMKAAAEHVAPVTLELGGKSPNIVFADADLDAAINGVVGGIFASTGQMCIAGGRLLVQEEIHDELVERLRVRAASIRLGDPQDPASEMGPLVSEAQLEKVLALVASGVAEGATLVTGGKRAAPAAVPDGYFVEPTIFAGVQPDMQLAREEVFGPVLAVVPFRDEEHAIELGNDTVFGLAGGVWTKDVQRAHRMARRLRCGVVWINCYRNTSPHVPFGGMQQSGFGRENGPDAILDYTQVKSVWLELSGATRDPLTVPRG